MRFASAATILSAIAALACVSSVAGQELFGWLCSVDGSIDNVESCSANIWSSCSTDCGRGSQSRYVFCTSFTEQGEIISYDNAPSNCVTTPPAASRSCSENKCANVEWLCYSQSDASDRASCDDGAFFSTCPANYCGNATSTRSVGCFSGSSRVGNNKCKTPPPASSKKCPLVTSTCVASFEGATCRNAEGEKTTCLAEGANADEIIADGHCSTPSGDRVSDAWCAAGTLTRKCDVPACSPNQKFSWKTQYGECVDTTDVCSSYRTASAVCKDNTDTVVDNLLCEGKRPADHYESCPGELTCENGVCEHYAVEGVEGATAGVCHCHHGFNGPTCSQTIAVHITEMELFGAALMIRWNLSAPAPEMAATIEASGAGLDVPVTLAVVDAESAAYSAELYIISQYFAPGPVNITVTVFGSSAQKLFDAPALCTVGSYECTDGNGICNQETGHCDCNEGYEGIRCSESPCDLKGCAVHNSMCVQNTTTDVATCKCEADTEDISFFSDDLCITPKGCDSEAKCLNNGVRTGHITDGAAVCTGCQCTGNWGGATCEECSLTNVCHNSVPDKDCTTCICSAGYKAYGCGCRYATLRVAFAHPSVPWFTLESTNSDANMKAWFTGIQATLTHIANASDVFVDVVSAHFVNTTRTVNVQVDVQFSGMCGMTILSVDPEMDSVYAAMNNVRKTFAGNDLGDYPGFSGLNTEAGLGLDDVNCRGDGCPRNLGNGGVPPDDSHKVKKHLRGGEIAGIVIVAIVAVLLIALVAYSYMYEKLCFATEDSVSKLQEEEAAAVAAAGPAPTPVETTADRVNNIEMATLSTDV